MVKVIGAWKFVSLEVLLATHPSQAIDNKFADQKIIH